MTNELICILNYDKSPEEIPSENLQGNDVGSAILRKNPIFFLGSYTIPNLITISKNIWSDYG